MNRPMTANWTGDAAFAWFESRTNLERLQPQLRMYRLERMETLLRRLNSPETTVPVVHIAGSKGKGSTSAYIASLLAASGHRVGMYTSPHVRGYRERFTVLPPGYAVGEPVPSSTPESALVEGGSAYEDALARESYRIRLVVEEMAREGTADDDLPTTFELLTALAFLFFPALGCDRIVLETGLGGRLDATNVCLPEVAVITRIEREHTDYLGETIGEIAREKAGIIKPDVPVVCAAQRPEAYDLIRRVAEERNAPFVAVEEVPFSPLETAESPAEQPESPWRGRVAVPARLLAGDNPAGDDPAGGTTVLRPAMIGTVQQKNIIQALTVYRLLADRGVVHPAPPETLRRAVETCRLPGRGEVIDGVFLDGAHTPESVTTVVQAYRQRFGDPLNIPVILGIVAGKDVEGIAAALKPVASVVIVSTPGRFKPGDPQNVADRVAAAGLTVDFQPDHEKALQVARDAQAKTATADNDGAAPPILVTGSFYMVAEIRRLVVP